MSRAQFKVEAGEKITIDLTQYRVAEHPALPGIPYVQRGARGFVIQLIAPNGDRRALKYFKLKYRVPALLNVTEALKQYADLPGLRAAQRTVFSKDTHRDLLNRNPALEYGVLMPWLPGVTWYDIVTMKAPLAHHESIKLAQSASAILAGFEERGIAHCDIAGANVMVIRQTFGVELVDIEEMHGPGLPPPVELPAGQDGYQHSTSRQRGQWSAEGDRFGAAILLTEILGWSDQRIRQNSADEHYFSAAEMQDPASPRFRLLYEVLRDTYSAAVAEAFEQAWRSATLADCPPIKVWHDTLDAIHVDFKAQPASAPAAVQSPVVSGRRAIDGVPIVVNSTPTANPANPGNPTAETGPERLNLSGSKLCRNCGAQNPSAGQFCNRCGFYIGTGARRPAPKKSNADFAAPISTKAPPQPITPTGTAPQSIPLQRDTHEIISARRIGSVDGEIQRVATPRDPSQPQDEGNFGRWIVIALVLGTAITILALALLGGR
jgi:ribosomal protein L40E